MTIGGLTSAFLIFKNISKSARLINRKSNDMIKKDDLGLYHPKSAEEISELVKYAIDQKCRVRVRGAAQSIPASISDPSKEAPSKQSETILIQLDEMRYAHVDEEKLQVTVGAGINLNYDPYDPSCHSNRLNGLYRLINKYNMALPNVPDAAHQTVGGYMSTGSSGATMSHSFDECILQIKLVNGTGESVTLSRNDDPSSQFYGAGSSMGLMGIIYEVTLQCVPAFDIIGHEHINNADEAPYDLFGTSHADRKSVQEYFSDQEFTRTLWWPYSTLHRTITWEARKMYPEDYNLESGDPANFKPKPYEPVFPKIYGSRYPSELLASTLFKFVGTWPNWVYGLLKIDPNHVPTEIEGIIQLVDGVSPDLYPLMIDIYFPINNDDRHPQKFWDRWLGSLVMDKFEFSNTLMNLDYAELWFDIKDSNRVTQILKAHFDKGGEKATGVYTVELLAAKKSNFWMSPSYGRDSFRLNFMRFADDIETSEDFYQQYFELFRDSKIDFRLHWGKALPQNNSAEWAQYLRDQYEKFDAFESLRKQMDPHSIFINDYWLKHLIPN